MVSNEQRLKLAMIYLL